MDPWKPSDAFFQPPPSVPLTNSGFHTSCTDLPSSSDQLQPGSSCLKIEQESKDSITARKVQKADREKLRRDKLNEQFSELGNTLDPDRPKNDKATILTDAIQVLKDLTAQLNRMKAEHASLCDESRELVQEKNELREEKATLKADIDNLNAQYHQRLRALFPWPAMDPSVVMGPPPPYSFPMPLPITSGPVPVHPTQPYHFFRNQNPGTIPIHYSMYRPYSSSFAIAQVDPPSNHRHTPHHHASSNNSHTTSAQDSKKKTSNDQHQICNERSDDFSDVATELELKTPGSSMPCVHSEAAKDQDVSSKEGKRRKQWSESIHRKGNIVTEASQATSSSRCSSSILPDSSCTSAGDETVTNNQ